MFVSGKVRKVFLCGKVLGCGQSALGPLLEEWSYVSWFQLG